MKNSMIWLPPPVWALIYVLIAAAISWSLGWPKIPGLPLAVLGIALVVGALILPVWAILLFRRDGTEVSPTSPSNRKLVVAGPYRLTRNPMYLGLVILTLSTRSLTGVDKRLGWRGGIGLSSPNGGRIVNHTGEVSATVMMYP
jgi:protein-S-isoprenylcysteine O-methyltransferase Ste14